MSKKNNTHVSKKNFPGLKRVNSTNEEGVSVRVWEYQGKYFGSLKELDMVKYPNKYFGNMRFTPNVDESEEVVSFENPPEFETVNEPEIENKEAE